MTNNNNRYEYTTPDFDPNAEPIEYTDEELDAMDDDAYVSALIEQQNDHLNRAVYNAKQTGDWDYVDYLIDNNDAIGDAYAGLRGRRLQAAMDEDRNAYIANMTPERRAAYYAEQERRAKLTPEEREAEDQATFDELDLDLDAPF